MILRAYKYRLYPTEAQKVLLSKHFGCARWVYNWALSERMKAYEKDKKTVSIYEISGRLPDLKKTEETKWLSEVSAQALINALFNLDKAYTRFFKEKKGFPKFKSRRDNHQSFQNHQHNRVDFDTGRFYLYKFREGIKCAFSRRFDGNIKTCTVSRTPSGKYYVSILVETPAMEPTPPPATEATAIGLDFGLKDIVVTSDGQRFENPRHLKRFQRRLAIRQRRLSRKTKGSNNRDKARHRVARVHEHLSNIRRDSLHKLSHTLVVDNQATTICIEDLDIVEMMGKGKKGSNRGLRRSISDVGWGYLRQMLEYKCKWYGKNLKVIGQFDPSSKRCSHCGTVNRELKLSDREWTCPSCHTFHDRDVNAAINIRHMAFEEHNTYSTKVETGKKQRLNKIPRGTRKSTPVDQSLAIDVKRECHSLVAQATG